MPDLSKVTLIDRLTIAKQLATPKIMDYVIAANRHLGETRVRAIADELGYPSIVELRNSAARLQREVDTEQNRIPTGPSEVDDELDRRRRIDRIKAEHEIVAPPARNKKLETSPPDMVDPRAFDQRPPEQRTPPRPQPVGQPMRQYDATAQLLLEAKECESKRIVALAEKVEQLLIDLRDRLTEWKQGAAQRAREDAERQRQWEAAIADVRRAEEALKAAREKAASLHGPTTPRKPSTGDRTAQTAALKARVAYYADFLQRQHVTDGDLRTWAREHEFTVARFGTVPRAILDAYEKAHPADGAA